MFDFREIQKLVDLVQSRDIEELSVSHFFSRVKIRKRMAEAKIEQVASPSPPSIARPVPVVVPEPSMEDGGEPEETEASGSDQDLVPIRSPMVGTFYRSPGPDADPFVEIGRAVRNGQVVCIVEAMKLMNEIQSEIDGTVVKVLVENAQPVEYDETLFLVRTS